MGTACRDIFIVLQAYTTPIQLGYSSHGTTRAEAHTVLGSHFKKTNQLQWVFTVNESKAAEINFRTNEMEESRFCNLVTPHLKSFTAWTCLCSDAGFKSCQAQGVLKQ